MFSLASYAFLIVIARSFAYASPIRFQREPVFQLQAQQKRGGFEIPLRRQVVRRDGEAGAVGLGDFEDL